MARRTRSASLENRTNRLKLTPRKKPYTALIAPGIFLAYRSNAGPGTWSVRCNGWLKRFGLADDHEDANGESVMSYWQALEHAKSLARAGEGNSEQPRPLTPMRPTSKPVAGASTMRPSSACI